MSRPTKAAKPDPIAENSIVIELLDVLKKHNAPASEDLKGMIENTAKIEQQLATAIAELAAMRRELAAIREDNHPMRKVLQNAIIGVQDRILALRQQLETMKAAIVDGCENVLKAFKERGAAALNGLTQFFKVRPALEAIAKSCDQAAKENTQTISKIERISREYHKTGQHLRNIGRAMTGKELITSMKPVGKVAKAAEAPMKAARACNLAMRDAARDALKSLSRLEKSIDRPKLIKEQLNTAAKQAAAYNARNAPDKTKTTPAVEL